MNEATSARAALELRKRGFRAVYVLEGGWFEWVRAGYPLDGT